jgi:hypothetical protein
MKMKSRKWKLYIKRLIAGGHEPCVVDFRNGRVTNLRDGSVEEIPKINFLLDEFKDVGKIPYPQSTKTKQEKRNNDDR